VSSTEYAQAAGRKSIAASLPDDIAVDAIKVTKLAEMRISELEGTRYKARASTPQNETDASRNSFRRRIRMIHRRTRSVAFAGGVDLTIPNRRLETACDER
jgi:hypothetical protein